MKFFFLLCCFCFALSTSQAQTDVKQKTEVQLAHDLKGKKGEFLSTKNGQFKAKLYSIEPPTTNKTHHWFLQILDQNDQFLNISNISLHAFHESDKSLKLNFIDPVFSMCNEGKYIIGFVNVDKTGTWILELTINHFDLTDTITLEMEVGVDEQEVKGKEQ